MREFEKNIEILISDRLIALRSLAAVYWLLQFIGTSFLIISKKVAKSVLTSRDRWVVKSDLNDVIQHVT